MKLSIKIFSGLPDPGFVIYIGLNCAVWALLWFSIQKQFGIHEWNPHYLAFLASSGPVIIAQMMANITENSKLKRSIFYPFHKGQLILKCLFCVFKSPKQHQSFLEFLTQPLKRG